MMTPHPLDHLEQRLAQDLAWLNLPPKAWVPERAGVLDVAVIGGGVLGLTALAALRRVGITNIRGFDRAPAGREGPWITYARMETLRTRKEAAGPALGIPSLTFRAWYEAQFGAAAWDALGLIPRAQWMEYLVWYRRVLDLPLTNDAAVTEVRPDGDVVHLTAGGERLTARRVVIATGLDGLGAPSLPAVAGRVPSRFVAHGADMIDMAALQGRRVAVIGAGASAMDNAAAALEAGAASVDIFVRRPDIPRVDKFTGIGSQGMTQGYVALPDALKWAFMVAGERAQIPPPRHSVLRVVRHKGARFHLSSPIEDMAEVGDGIVITTPKGRYPVDFAIFATGFTVDFAKRPEFAALDGQVRLWRDAYAPPAGMDHDGLGSMPYLGPAFEFLPKVAGANVGHVHCFAYPAVPSHGKITSGVPSIGEGAMRLAQGIARSIFVEEGDLHLQRFHDFTTPELLGDEFTDADLKEPSHV
ncbi:NAD(P)-binding domain-containing protein [Falsirhodobacter halotolerans]|uniref:NAD(P)-binding domain-containing protein n=1 Tax=Falsirhodobacter halotolerans TaxID=1146892 RepID=UPI001FD250BE|nr:NAD(P)/FAD-dependent oxidoreductase [Falsirhodobacter halotolerans]MCJ8141137.1 NAD(P)/FAD-dependent oxidoreductase [Falsirhodobacter halotolerans]